MNQRHLFDLPDVKSPLGYPGGKRKLWPCLKEYLPNDLTELVSPFMGGGAIELLCTSRGITVQGSDNDEPLINFWEYFIEDAKELVDLVCSIYPLSFEEKTYYFDTRLEKDSNKITGGKVTDLERAAIYFCINRQSFRAWGLCRPACKYEELKPLTYFTRWENWQNRHITVSCSDYTPIIENANGRFMYLDPPYVGKEYFYGDYKRANKNDFDHHHLSYLLRETKSKWILSYGNHELVKDLYKDYTILEPQWKYAIRSNGDTKSDELLILNL